MDDSIISIIISSICSGSAVWIFTLKYTKKQAEADAMKAVQEVYQQLISDMKSDREELKNRISELEEKAKKSDERMDQMTPLLCSRMECLKRIFIKNNK